MVFAGGDSAALEKGITPLIPANTTATIAVPTSDVRKVLEGGKPIPPNSGIKLAGSRDGYALFNTGAGTYRFSVIK